MFELQELWAGRLPYQSGLKLQDDVASKVRAGLSDASPSVKHNTFGVVIGLEHPSVITLGKRGDPKVDLFASEAELKRRSVELVTVPRGGQATLHSRGQLVIYPILPIAAWGFGVREFVRLLERVTIEFLQIQGVPARCGKDEPGLYTDVGKIAFFGLKISSGISSHGLAINVANDLSLFGLIRSCGRENESFDQLANYVECDGSEANLRRFFEGWLAVFRQHLQKRALTISSGAD